MPAGLGVSVTLVMTPEKLWVMTAANVGAARTSKLKRQVKGVSVRNLSVFIAFDFRLPE
jgi:hypothetical protein